MKAVTIYTPVFCAEIARMDESRQAIRDKGFKEDKDKSIFHLLTATKKGTASIISNAISLIALTKPSFYCVFTQLYHTHS